MGPEDKDAEREVRAAVAAVERALERVRHTRKSASGLDVQVVREALDDAERWLKRAQQRLTRARQRVDVTVVPADAAPDRGNDDDHDDDDGRS